MRDALTRRSGGYRRWPSTLLLLLLFVFKMLVGVDGRFCYSCSGTCHSEPCNCQMGSCEADYCFTEKRPSELPGVFRILKGCVKRPSRTRIGCDFERSQNAINCLCSGDFCNDAIYMRSTLRRNITCRRCTENEPDCDDTCSGQWCYEDTKTGASNCGFGPPTLPYHYQGYELLAHRSKVCVSLSRGVAGESQRLCICNTHLCNAFARNRPSLALAPSRSRSLTAHHAETDESRVSSCVSCEVSTENNALTSACRQQKCFGHFCTFSTQRILLNTFPQRITPQAFIQEKQGCLNVTDPRHVQLGCTHKWLNNEEEELHCACRGDECNTDLHTASSLTQQSAILNNAILIIALSLAFLLSTTNRLVVIIKG